jgi:hypothetical protein
MNDDLSSSARDYLCMHFTRLSADAAAPVP